MNKTDEIVKAKDYKSDIQFSFKNEWHSWIKHLNWPLVIMHFIVHSLALYGLLTFPYSTHKLTALWTVFYFYYVGSGITIGAHRLWTHRSFKAKAPLRILLAGGYYGAGKFKLRQWIKLHRIHHKYTDTDADLHNINRGFWFAHMGWYLLPKHPEFLKRIKEIDMSDVNADPVVTFGDKYFVPVTILMTLIFPTFVPVILWNESWYWAIVAVLIRYVTVINVTSSVNSVAHTFGYKPYDRNIKATDTKIVQILTFGEGWHNFHHVFPWDYRAGEVAKIDFNLSLYIIDQFKKIGWAYDCKVVSDELIRKVAEKRGDENYNLWKEVPESENY